MKPKRIYHSHKKHSIIENIIAALIYSIVFDFIYVNYICAYFAYDGIHYSPIGGTEHFFLIVQAVIPILFFRGYRNVASALSFFIYLLVYVPFIEVVHIAGFSDTITAAYGALFTIIMCAFFYTDKIYLMKFVFLPAKGRKKAKFSPRLFEIIVIILLLGALALNIHNIRFVNFFSDAESMYDMRAGYQEGTSSLVHYLVAWLEHGFVPVLFVLYLASRQKIKAACAFAAFIVLYMISMQKITLLIPFVMVGMYFLYSINRTFFYNHIHTVIIVLIVIASLAAYGSVDTLVGAGIAMILLYRTVCIEGAQLDRYLNFFETSGNPYTHYSHLNIVNKITNSYPYGSESIGQVVDGNGANSNATFLLMDGVAADGILGCIIVAVVFIVVKSIMNSIGLKYNFSYVAISLLFVALSLANTSLFTSLFSFGMLVIYLIYALFDLKPLTKKYDKCNWTRLHRPSYGLDDGISRSRSSRNRL